MLYPEYRRLSYKQKLNNVMLKCFLSQGTTPWRHGREVEVHLPLFCSRYPLGKNLLIGEDKSPFLLDIGRSVYHFCNIYTVQRDTQCGCTDCLLVLRCQLYMFWTITVHPQELLCRYCMCRLWYVVRNALSGTSTWYNQLDVSGCAVLTTYHSLHIQYLQRSSWGWTVMVQNM